MAYVDIRCQEPECNYGKKYCCFGELDTSLLAGGQIVERHKCKANSKKLIYIKIPSCNKYLRPPSTTTK